MKLHSKNILFISSNYFGYYEHIVKALTRFGARVDWFSDTPTGKMSRIKSMFLENGNVSHDKHYGKLKKNLSCHYDYIFVIKGDVVPDTFLDYLKDRYKNAQFIMYHWDDIDLFPNVKGKFKYFDRILSYNIGDCKKYKLILRPIFFVPILNVNYEKTIDVSIVGSYNLVREKFINKFQQLNPEVEIYSHYYINPLMFVREKLPLVTCKNYKFYKLSYKEMLKLVSLSKACLDVPHFQQQGLTTRSIEALQFQTKVITTNTNIKLYDYYSEKNHYIVDLDNPVIDKDWINEPYEIIDKEIVEKYTIDYWIKDIFDL